MTTENEPPAPGKRPRTPAGCLLRVLIAIIVAVAIVIAIGFAFDQGDNADQPETGFNVGPAAGYQSGTVSYLEAEHIFVTRLTSGEVMALYDLSTRQQELGGDCRLHYEDVAVTGTLEPLPGISGAIVEDCNNIRAVWRADGVYAFGVGYGDLDRFATHVSPAGDLIVDTSSRSCLRSRGVAGVPPYDARQCQGAP